MRKIFLMLLCLSLLAIGSTALAGNQFPPFPSGKYSRNATYELRDGNTLLLSCTHEYIGKKPVGKYKSKHDYKKIDTDFSKVTWKNHTNYTVEFLSMKTWPELSTTGLSVGLEKGIKKKSSVTTLDLTKVWKINYIKPGAKWYKANHYYYSQNKPWNVRHNEYTVRINGKIYKMMEHMVYIK